MIFHVNRAWFNGRLEACYRLLVVARASVMARDAALDLLVVLLVVDLKVLLALYQTRTVALASLACLT
jgi:hypothetical protein